MNFKVNHWWFRDFKDRNPELVFRKAISMEKERVQAATRENIEGFYHQLVRIIQENDLQPDQIHNVDESFLDLSVTGKVLVCKGDPYYQELKAGKGEHVTLVSTISANGRAMPHILIMKGQSIPVELKLGPSIRITATERGWIDSEVKSNWFAQFVEYIGNQNKRKEECKTHLLLLDGHESNWNDEMISLARKKNVIIFQFPPHLTHILQPLDSNFFHKVKQEVRKGKASEAWKQVQTKWDLITFVETPLHIASNPQTIKDSFKIAGVYPPTLRKEKIRFDLHKFLEGKKVCLSQSLIILEAAPTSNLVPRTELTEKSVTSTALIQIPANQTGSSLVPSCM